MYTSTLLDLSVTNELLYSIDRNDGKFPFTPLRHLLTNFWKFVHKNELLETCFLQTLQGNFLFSLCSISFGTTIFFDAFTYLRVMLCNKHYYENCVVFVIDVHREKCLRLDNEKYVSEAFAAEDFSEALSCLQKKMSEMLPRKF